MKAKTSGVRLFSIDALRGFDMFWLVGGCAFIRAFCKAFPDGKQFLVYRQFTHVAWEGLHFYDLVFPVFLFVAGLSYPFSHAGQVARGASAWSMHRKILVRAAVLFVLGCVYNGLFACDWHEFAKVGYTSVLGKIGIAWGVAALVYLHTTWRGRLVVSAAGLLGYAALLLMTSPDAPAGAGPVSLKGCFVGYLDRLVMPEWLVGTDMPPSNGPFVSFFRFPNALLGMCAGDLVRSSRFTPVRKALMLALAGIAALILGYAASVFCPLVKNLWTPSFTLVASGYGCLAFALFYWIIDVRGWVRWSFPFRLIGMNAIAVYLLFRLVDLQRPAKQIFGIVASAAGDFGPAVIVLVEIAIVFWLLNILYRHKIFFKV